jgi:preprotein translocase subunit SecB
MAPIKKMLQLDSFFVKKLHVDCASYEQWSKINSDNPFIDYTILRNPKNGRQFAIDMLIRAFSGKDPSKPGLIIEASLVGFFSFSDDSSEDEMQYLIRINGATILYGLLRGHIISITGAFPYGPFLLPSIYMDEIIPKIEMRKRASSSASQSTKQDTKVREDDKDQSKKESSQESASEK